MVIIKIFLIRGKKVMLDYDLAELYGIETRRLKEQVRRNPDRFPEDFMFELTKDEFESLRSQNATSKKGRGGARYLPMVFTEHGVLMLSSVLNSQRAIQVNIRIMRVYTKMKEMLLTHKDILLKLEKLELQMLQQSGNQKKLEADVHIIFLALEQLLNPPQLPRKRIGFRTEKDKD